MDDADFKTLENGLTIANTDIVISANGGADTVKNSGGATAHGAGGIYTLTWDATDTAAVGELSYSVKVAGALVVFGTYVVLEEAVYDALFAAAAVGPLLANSDGSGLTAINLPNQTMDIVGNITGNLSGSVGSVTGAVGSVTGAVGSVTGAVGSVTGNVGGNVAGTVASVVGAVGSVTGNVGGNVVGSVASVTAKVTPIDVDGITFANWAKYVGATTQGKCVVTFISGSDYTYDYYNVAGDTILWTTTATSGGRAQPTRS